MEETCVLGDISLDVALTCKLLYLKHVLWWGGSFCLFTELMAHRFLGHNNERAVCKEGFVCLVCISLPDGVHMLLQKETRLVEKGFPS